jgi:hypothetical protein
MQGLLQAARQGPAIAIAAAAKRPAGGLETLRSRIFGMVVKMIGVAS